MNISRWLSGLFTDRGKALRSYRRGMLLAKKHDHQGAIEQYSFAIGAESTPADVRAMALYNRAMVYAAIESDDKAIADLKQVLAMKERLEKIKTEARRKLVRMDRRSEKHQVDN